MNATTTPETTALAVQSQSYEVGQVTDAAALILGPSFERVQSFAGLMAKGAVSVPKHLRGNMGDCMAITIQALGWRMNPFAVAQKTHLSQSGALGYEAQLVSAILVSTGAVKSEPDYEPIGDWSKVLGKVEERTGKARDDGSPGGKYYIATYTKKDEEGLGVIVRATLANGHVRELPVMLSQAYPRFSTQWATDPYQQLCYLAVRKWGRLHSPGAILGVYTPDELETGVPEKYMGPADVVGAPPPPPAPPEKPEFTEEHLTQRLAKIAEFYKGGKTAGDIIDFYSLKAKLPEAMQKRIRGLEPKADVSDAEPKGAPAVTYAQLADRLTKCGDFDTAALILDEARALPDDQQKDLSNLYAEKFGTKE